MEVVGPWRGKLTTVQIMDGSPSRGETIPIRLFLGGFDLTPTFRDVNKKFSTRYYLSLVLIDEGKSTRVFSWKVFTLCTHELRRCTKILQTIRDHPLSTSPGNCKWRRARWAATAAGRQDNDRSGREVALCCRLSVALFGLNTGSCSTYHLTSLIRILALSRRCFCFRRLQQDTSLKFTVEAAKISYFRIPRLVPSKPSVAMVIEYFWTQISCHNNTLSCVLPEVSLSMACPESFRVYYHTMQIHPLIDFTFCSPHLFCGLSITRLEPSHRPLLPDRTDYFEWPRFCPIRTGIASAAPPVSPPSSWGRPYHH